MPSHAEDGTVEIDVFSPGEFGVEACPDFKEGADAPFDLDAAARWRGDARQNFEKGRFAGTVGTDDPEDFALLDVEGDIFKGVDEIGVGIGVFVGDHGDAGVRILLPAELRPPSLQILGESAVIDET